MRKLSNSLQCDLIVLMADNMDALRNWEAYYLEKSSNLDRFMGGDFWKAELVRASQDRRAEVLLQLYQQQLKSLDYKHFGHEQIKNSHGTDIYKLLYASRHPKGLEFWRKASLSEGSGQKRFDF